VDQFVNDQSFPFSTRRDMTNWLGDHPGLAIAGGAIYAVWTDPRVNHRSHVFFARGALPWPTAATERSALAAAARP
jgi:hypothetical protein